MSLPDDWSGFCGPVPDIKLFGTPLHGKITAPYAASTGVPRYELHLPNGTVISKPAWQWPNVGQGVVFGIDDGRTWDFGQYGNGGTCYYWRRSDIGPPPVRTPAQQAYDIALGHQWRNDRINARWVWCDAAGDRWTVSINPSVGGSGLTKNVNISLRLTGAFNEPAITRSIVISIADPADVALPDDFHGRADAAWDLVLQDVHPIDGDRALFGVAREPIDWAEPYAVDDYGWFTLFSLSADQRDNILLLPEMTSSAFREQYYPRKVFTAHLELRLSGAARDGIWTAVPHTVRSRSQTAGAYTYSDPLPPITQLIDMRDVWAIETTVAPPDGADPNPFYRTFTAAGPELPWGTPRPANVPESEWSKRGTIYRGAGSCSVNGSGMIVGCFYDTAGALQVVSTDLTHSHEYDFQADLTQTGTRYTYFANGVGTVITETRQSTGVFAQSVTESTTYTIRINGVAVHSVEIGAELMRTSDGERIYNGNYSNPDLYASTIDVETAATANTDDIAVSGTFSTTHGMTSSIGSTLYDAAASPRASWLMRYGPKGAVGANPAATNLSNADPHNPDGIVARWRYNLPRCSNNTLQLRGAAYGSPLLGWPFKRVRIGPVICPTGAQGGVLTIPDTAMQLPPLCCSYNPFEETVVQDTVPTTFI